MNFYANFRDSDFLYTYKSHCRRKSPKMILQHHERLDGSGYPSGLVGDEILLEAQILAVADVVEAASSHRPYRPAQGIEKALDIIKEGKGSKFNAEAVDICVKLFEKKIFDFETV